MADRREGQFLVQDYFNLTGGLNTADSPFLVEPTQAQDGMNFDYTIRGAIQKRPGGSRVLQVADGDLITKGFVYYDDYATRTVLRAAGQHLKAIVGPGSATITLGSSITSDAASPSSTPFPVSTVPVVSTMFNTPSATTTWCAGSACTVPVGVYSTTKWTPNGVADVAGSLSMSATGSGSLPAGAYYYAVAYYKASTGTVGNAALDATVTVSGSNIARISFSGITGVDTTKYTKLYIYRSGISGAAAFTAGTLVTTLAISGASSTWGTSGHFDDDGTTAFTGFASSQVVPRAGNTALDNSALPAGTYNTLTQWKQRLITASSGTVYISDVNKPESWPTVNYFQIPSAGKVTALATVSLTSGISGVGVDEALVIFKEREVWAVTGNDYTDWVLTRIDNCGCSAQPLVVNAGGTLAWISSRGVFMWGGNGKPRYISQPVEDKFYLGGDIVKSELVSGFGLFQQQKNIIRWFLSSSLYGTQKYSLKLDLRLTEPQQQTNILGSVSKGIFNADTLSYAAYAGIVLTTSPTAAAEVVLYGDDAGYVYETELAATDPQATPYTFAYTTPHLTLGAPGTRKTLSKVVAWVQDNTLPTLNLDYWSDYKYSDTDKSTAQATVSGGSTSLALWDQALWDTATWPAGTFGLKPVTFYPNSQTNNNASGTAFRLRLTETSNTYTPVVYGFSVYYTESGTGV